MAIGRGKKLTAYKYPVTYPKWWPCLALMSHSTHIPILIACSILCLVLPHHCPTCTIIHRFLISPSVPASQGTCFSLSVSITVLMKSTKIHSPPLTLTHNPTPSSPHVKLPLKNPIISIVSKFHPNLSYPIYISLEAHQPVKRKGRRWHGHPLSLQFSLYWS